MTIDHIVNQEPKYTRREAIADTFGKITYSLLVGAPLDYYKAGLRGWGIVSSRALATVINTGTGTPYAAWRNAWYQFTLTTDESNKFRKALVELGAFNTFETYIYGIGAGIGSLIETGTLDFEKIANGMAGLFYLSPLIGPTMGIWLNATCTLFGVPPVAQRVEAKKQ